MYYFNNVYGHQAKNNYDSFYPEIYKEVYPFVVEAAEAFLRSGSALTADMLGTAVDNVIKKCGLWDEDEDSAATQSVYTNAPRRNRRGHHNRNTLRDLIRILYLRELLR